MCILCVSTVDKRSVIALYDSQIAFRSHMAELALALTARVGRGLGGIATLFSEPACSAAFSDTPSFSI